MDIVLVNHCKKKINQEIIKNTCIKTIKYLSKNISLINKDFLTVAFVDAKKIKSLNKDFRNKDFVTDILSFIADDNDDSLGDLVFCLEKMELQSVENQHSLHAEFMCLFIHGFLHLHGYNHSNKADEKLMFSIQDEAFYFLKNEGLVDEAFFI